MNELSIVCVSLVFLSLCVSVFYLSRQLAVANQTLADSLRDTLDHALANSEDTREFQRMRFERDVGVAKQGAVRRRPPEPMNPVVNDQPDMMVPIDPETGVPIPTSTYTG